MSLIHAIDNSNEELINSILENNPADIENYDEENRTALHYAAEMCTLATFSRIFHTDTTLLDARDNNGYTPLLYAIMVGRIEIADFLYSNGANVNHIDKEGHNIIHWAVVCGQVASLQWALEKKVNPNAKDFTQEAAPLHYATVSDDIGTSIEQALIITLLRNGANPNIVDKDGRSPILWCASNGNIEALKIIENSGGDISAKDRDSLGVLHCAASHGYHEVVQYYLSQMPNQVNQKDRAGHSPIFYSITYGHVEATIKLLQNDAYVNHQDNRLRTPSHCAASKGQLQLLRLLNKFNASFDLANYRGDLPFHEAVQSGSNDVVDYLLMKNENFLNAANHNGRTGLHLAAAAGNLQLVIFLCNKKCNINPIMFIKDTPYTPLDLAREQKRNDVVDYLTKEQNAKSHNDYDSKYLQDYLFELQNKIEKDKYLQLKKAESRMERHLQKLRRHSQQKVDDFVANKDNMLNNKYYTDIGTNTSTRETQSADGSTKRDETQKISKATSMTSLNNKINETETNSKEKSNDNQDENDKTLKEIKEELEILRERMQNNESKINLLDLADEEFEELPPLSDESDKERNENETDDKTQKEENKAQGMVPDEDLKNNEDFNQNEEKVQKKLVIKEEAEEMPSRKQKKIKKSKSSEKRPQSEIDTERMLMRVRREPEIGNDAGDIDVYHDDEKAYINDSKSPISNRSSTSNSRLIHEKAIFQELTHLKRMQIQYGRVQEKILVRSLITNFCKMHSLDPKNFKFHTFYAWEKFLYDALSEQLKMIYLEERERLGQSNSEMTTISNRFEKRIRRSVPFNERVNQMQQAYANSTIRKSKFSSDYKSTGAKRCECLGKHLIL